MTLDPSLARRLRELARGPAPLLVASDLDGTLAPIVPRAEDARVPPATLAALERLAGAAHVAVVTGRDLATARALAPVPGVEFVASHGHEVVVRRLRPPFARPRRRSASRSAYAGRRGALRGHGPARRAEGAFRCLPLPRRPRSLAAPLRAALADLPAGLRLQPGRLVLEVLPEGAGKGAAVAALVERFRPGSMLALGDDLTDVAMFEAATALRAKGAHVLTLAVEGGAEMPPEVVAASDAAVVQGQVGQLLALLAAELAGPPPP